MKQKKNRFFMVTGLFLIVAILVLPCRPAPAQEEFEEEEMMIRLNFEDTSLSDIVKLFAEQLHKNFLLPTPLTATITIISGDKIPQSAAFDILQTILNTKNFMLVETEHLIKVVPIQPELKPAMTKFLEQPTVDDVENKENMVTAIIIPQYTDAREILNLLSNFRHPNAIMEIFSASNALIIKDTEANLRYMLELIKRVDVSGSRPIITIHKLIYAPAKDVAPVLEKIITTKGVISIAPATPAAPLPTRPPSRGRPAKRGGGPAEDIKIIPYERMNALIIVALEKETEEILGLIEKLDRPPIEGDYSLHIFQAKNQEAGDLAKVMVDFVKQIPKIEGGKGGPPMAAAGRRGGDDVFFTADEATNKILIYAPPQDYEMYLMLLEELDQPQPQVLIETWVVEISSTNQFDIGVEFLPSTIPPGERSGPMVEEIYAASSFALGSSAFASSGTPPGSGFSALFRTINNTKIKIGDTVFRVPDFDAFLQILETNTDVNLLQSPKLMAMNNEEATVEITDEISISSSQVSGVGDDRDLVETFDRVPVGITLSLKPQINADGYVIMEVDLSVKSLVGEDIGSLSSRPVVADRVTKNKIRIQDGETIVISGLRRNDKSHSVSKVPLLGDIPILGALFRSISDINIKTNLLIFITPHIVTDTPEMLKITDMIKNQDLEKERPRFQEVKKSRRRRRKKK